MARVVNGKESLLVMVDGVPTVVTYRGNPTLLQIATRALDQTPHSGQPAGNWQLHTSSHGLQRDLSVRLDTLDLPANAQVFLNPIEDVACPAGTAAINWAEPGILWDESGLEWTTKHMTWATEKQVRAFLRRGGTVGFIDGCRCVSWLDSAAATRFWAQAEGYFEVPGVSGSRLTQPGVRWGAHIWRRGTQRRLVFLMFA
jgi:hypothetical protein